MSSPLPGFSRLADGVSYLKPADPTPPTSPSPHLIILCTWMGAAPKHISKYTAAHRALFPTTPLLVIQSDLLDVFYRTEAAQLKRMSGARSLIRDTLAAHTDPAPRILLHVFSNGGAQTACQLAGQLRAETGRVLPLTGVVLDSCPGRASFRQAVKALMVSLPRSVVLRALGTVLVYAVLVLYTVTRVLGAEDLVVRVRRELNDGVLFAVAAPRLYVFSRADNMVDWRDVHEHAAVARSKGYAVDEELYETSPHCGHAMVDKDRYWRVVEAKCK